MTLCDVSAFEQAAERAELELGERLAQADVGASLARLPVAAAARQTIFLDQTDDGARGVLQELAQLQLVDGLEV